MSSTYVPSASPTNGTGSIVIPRDSETECPLGFICDKTTMANCTLVRQLPIEAFEFGDIHAGLYCPAGEEAYLNCPVGFYCPNPETILPCPAGKFCPHKTAIVEIDCIQCDQGSIQVERETYGYIVIALLVVMMAAGAIITLFKRNNAALYAHLLELKDRQMDSVRYNIRIRKRRAQLEKVRPKLEIISERLRSIREESESETTSLTSSKHAESIALSTSGTIKFNAQRFFDTLDTDGSGSLSFAELNTILGLNPLQLQEFVRQMNELGGVSSDAQEVSRAVFVRYFLDVLEESSHFGPSKEEAGRLFDEIASQGTNKYGGVDPEKFYTSSLSDFLSDTQINDLLTRIRRMKAENDDSLRSSRIMSISNMTSHLRDKREGPPRAVRREDFVEYYPRLLNEVIANPDPVPLLSSRPGDTDLDKNVGVDIAFEDLSLAIKFGNESVNVVEHVTGRLEARTMTALMGGSGAGKTSLLNALCGRAFYGDVTGVIKVNGQNTTIEEHSSAVGFVPQDDIVYAELTVRENFIYSGRFQLPAGTPRQDIEDLADATLANLGLSRVANSLVGDVYRRGVSGGEKKRVNIGLELMSRPSIIFLDEPTSGLDSSSALLVMQSLKTLVENQGVTVCSVIHQPRKFIFDLFDSLILLGVGGRMVYHGTTRDAEAYFMRLNYTLPPGESVADWLIDISSGRLPPDETVVSSQSHEPNGHGMTEVKLAPSQDDDGLRSAGPSGNKVENAFEEAKVRREVLYKRWIEHFRALSDADKAKYSAPEPSTLPHAITKPSFWRQLVIQLERYVLVWYRNIFTKLVDTSIIVGAVIIISALQGVVEVTTDDIPNVSYDNMVSENPSDLVSEFGDLFAYALVNNTIQQYALKVGVITSVLVGLTAAKTITDKRLEFFRESGSGYNINAYFFAINITSTIEHSVQIIIAAACAFWLRDSIANWDYYYVNFLMMTWLCVSWAIFIPLLVSPKSVVLAVGFFMAFFGLLFCGAQPPILYSDIYDGNPALAVFCGFVSTTRFFIESMVVAETRCLPAQSGYTIVNDEASANFPMDLSSFALIGFAQNDDNVTERSCSGWYWGVLPALLVGLTVRFAAGGAIHISDRPQQAKKSLWNEIKKQRGQNDLKWSESIVLVIIIYMLILLGLFAASCWAILRQT